MPRSSSVVSLDARRLEPPASMTEAGRRHFLDLIDALPPTHFQPADATLLAGYCEAAAAAELAAGEMALAGGIVTKAGRLSPWFTAHALAVKTMSALALRLRLSPQARVAKASKKEPGPRLSYYEREAMRERGRHG